MTNVITEGILVKRCATLILLVLSLAPLADGATVKEVQTALSEKYQITKRKLTGGFKKPGTVVYVAIPDFSVEVPRSVISSLTISNGRVDPESISENTERRAVPIGEPLYILSHQVENDLIRVHLATVSTYPARIFGVDQKRDMQVKIEFPVNEGLESINVDEALSLVSAVIATNAEAQEQPALSAMIDIRRDQLSKPIEERGSRSGVQNLNPDPAMSESPETSQSEGRSMSGLEPIGVVNKPGCDGIEIVGYAERPLGTGQTSYYVAIRNTTAVAKIVKVRHIGGKNVRNRLRDDTADIQVGGGAIKQYHIDLALRPPKLFEVNRCL